MAGVWRAAARAHVERVPYKFNSPLDRPDQSDLHRATLARSSFALVNGRMGSRHPDQPGVHQLAHRHAAILPHRRSLTVYETAIPSITDAMSPAAKFTVFLIWLLGLGLALEGEAQAQVDVVVSFVTTNSTPLNPGFGGFNTSADNAVEYFDTNFQQMVTALSPGWLRYPAGTESDAFDWLTGQMVPAWVDGLATNPGPQTACAGALPKMAGKGGALFRDFAALACRGGGGK